MGKKPSHEVQFPAGRRLDRGLIRNSLEPEAVDGGPTDNEGMTAVACELADRDVSQELETRIESSSRPTKPQATLARK